jgi:hypothetical protein
MRLIFAVICAALLTACGPSAEEASLRQENQGLQKQVTRNQTLDELKRAKSHAVVAGAKFASDGVLTKRVQCTSRLATDRMKQDVILRQFPEETQTPFREGCLREANVNVRNHRLAQQEAKRVAEKKTRLATAAKKGNKK